LRAPASGDHFCSLFTNGNLYGCLAIQKVLGLHRNVNTFSYLSNTFQALGASFFTGSRSRISVSNCRRRLNCAKTERVRQSQRFFPSGGHDCCDILREDKDP
jgi:hypothetical protein